ncbi:MarR family winged helix-turn-helix transcriptional regulator [Ideonella sp.]|uniref:MarR family winged helix-turn-helix transcriptional regulator n=1 Tax=Ideonella sp. TaxID=1929293 RepID=UPI003BB75AB7
MPPRPPRLVFLLNSAQRRLHQWMAMEQERAAIAGERLPTPAQSGVLFTLASTDGLSMGQLALALDLAPSAVSGLVQRMELLGWLERRASDTDARTLRVWLSPEGVALLPALRTALGRINARLGQGFSPEELQTVGRWLEHVQALGDVHA